MVRRLCGKTIVMRTMTVLSGPTLVAIAAPIAAHMTYAEMVLAKNCKRLTPQAMMQDRCWVALMKRHPEAVTKSLDMMKPQPPR